MKLSTIAALVLSLAATSLAHAQSYPTKTVRIIVGLAPGGTTDVFTRTLAQRLTEAWGQTVIVENRPGASGMIGAEAVAKAAPDGYTLLVSPQTSLRWHRRCMARHRMTRRRISRRCRCSARRRW
jgi:tripartite-type tricarboxylate transporter receptor subunit TctC